MPSSNGLGFNMQQTRTAPVQPTPVATPAPVSTSIFITMPASLTKVVTSAMPMFKGFLPLFLLSAAAGALPLVVEYVHEIDYTSNVTRGLFTGAAALVALSTLVVDCCTLYNMVLMFYTALEVLVVDKTLTYAMDAGTPDYAMGLAYAGAVVVIVHLVPFFTTDSSFVLTLFAVAGVPVNAALALFVIGDMFVMLLVASFAFLAMVRVVVVTDKYKPSMLTKLRESLESGDFLSCK